jgi:hypothetical protein
MESPKKPSFILKVQELVKKQCYQYLENIGYKVNLTDKQNGGVENGYAFDIWKTDVGTIWFKTPFFQGF